MKNEINLKKTYVYYLLLRSIEFVVTYKCLTYDVKEDFKFPSDVHSLLVLVINPFNIRTSTRRR